MNMVVCWIVVLFAKFCALLIPRRNGTINFMDNFFFLKNINIYEVKFLERNRNRFGFRDQFIYENWLF